MEKKYRKNVCIVIFNKEKKLLVCERLDSQGKTFAWQFPQGGIDEGENVLEAAKREAWEETSITSLEFVSQTEKPIFYDFPDNVFKKFGCKYSGQEQSWVLFHFQGNDSEIDIKTKIPEFAQWKWVDADFALNHVVPFKKEVYEKGINFFIPLIENYISSNLI
ncbi:MAG: RNA pyrophosphohydrolase [Alphaproteobacteria bacterium]